MNWQIIIPKQVRFAAQYAFLAGVGIILIAAANKREREYPASLRIDIEQLNIGSHLLTEAEVLATVQQRIGYHPTKLPIGEVPLDRFEELVESNPYVKEAKVFLSQTNVLHFSITQKMPVVRFVEQGASSYLDRQGFKIPLSSHYTARVPFLHGHFPKGEERVKWEEKELPSILYEMENHEARIWIDQVYRTRNGEYVIYPLLGNIKILVGEWVEMDDKLNKVDQFIQDVLPHKGWNTYEYIDVRYDNQVVAKMKV